MHDDILVRIENCYNEKHIDKVKAYIDKNIDKINNNKNIDEKTKSTEVKWLTNVKKGHLQDRLKKIKSGKNLS